MELPWVFVLLRHSELNLHSLDSPEHGLKNDTISVGCDFILPAIIDWPSWNLHNINTEVKKQCKLKQN